MPFAAPAVLIDRISGDFAGGRWVFVTADHLPRPEAIRALVDGASIGCHRLRMRPLVPVVEPGQPLSFTITYLRPGAHDSAPLHVEGHAVLRAGSTNPAVERPVAFSGQGRTVETTVVFPPGSVSAPSFCSATCLVGAPGPGDGAPLEMTVHSGCWVYPSGPFEIGVPVAVTPSGLTRNGRPFVAAGATFMPSDAQRRFLLEPGGGTLSALAGIATSDGNIIRTGIWTGWALHADPDGVPTPAILSALDALLLSAIREHGLLVIFTFFAFLPYSWGGVNPYLDPKAVKAQATFVTTIVRRYRKVKGIIWDLINEPSFSSAAQLWSTRPNDDEFEQRAWEAWLAERYPAPSLEAHMRRLQEIWRCAPGNELALPALADFTDANLFGDRHPLKALDYRLFAQEMFRCWTDTMRAAIKEAGGADALVTVGQDEGGVVERPSNQSFGASVDVTSIHTWWFNDDQLSTIGEFNLDSWPARVTPQFTTDAPSSVLVYPAAYRPPCPLHAGVRRQPQHPRPPDRSNTRKLHLVDLPAGHAAMLLIDRKSGDVVGRYPAA